MDAEWHKSPYSGSESPNCVECRTDDDQVLIRDTRHRERGALTFPASEWRAFLAAVKGGRL